jgi:hypothetical protein
MKENQVISDNFSVLKLDDTFNVFFNHTKEMCAELEQSLEYTSQATRLVASEDSSLGIAWDNIGLSMNNFSNQLTDLTTEIQIQIKKYIEETIKNETYTSQSIDSISKNIDNISNKLDSIFN